VAAEEVDSPFNFADIVTSTTHKSLRGPRAGMIFFRRGPKPADRLRRGEPEGSAYDYEDKIDFAVFPSLQGGPHNHQIGALAVALKQVGSPEFKAYAVQVKKNIKALAETLMGHGYKLVTNGTDNHLLLWDLRPNGVTGSKMERVCELAHITLNKNSVQGDTSAITPGGVRIGAPAMTSRGLKESDFEKVGGFLHRALNIALEVQVSSGKLFKDFDKALVGNKEVEALRGEVEAFAAAFPMPGFEVDEFKQ
jgi:glycine hydroxymethyltransferase